MLKKTLSASDISPHPLLSSQTHSSQLDGAIVLPENIQATIQEHKKITENIRGLELEALQKPQKKIRISREILREKSKLEIPEKLITLFFVSFFEAAKKSATQNKVEEALHSFRVALQIEESVHGSITDRILRALNSMAPFFELVGRREISFACYERALRIAGDLYGEDSDAFADMQNTLGVFLDKQNQFTQAYSCHESALRIRTQRHGKKSAEVANTLNNMSMLFEKQNQLEKALELLKTALAIFEQLKNPDLPGMALVMGNLGVILERQDKLLAALEYYNQALTLNKLLYGENSGGVASVMNNIGMVLEKQQKYVEASTYYEKALAIKKNIYGPHSQPVSVTLSNLAVLAKEKGQYETALAHYQSVLQIDKTLYGETSGNVAQTLGNIGIILKHQNKLEEAIDIYQKALVVIQTVYGAHSGQAEKILTNISNLLEIQDKLNEALVYRQQALAIVEKSDTKYNQSACLLRQSLANLHRRLAFQTVNEDEKVMHFNAAISCYETVLEIDQSVLSNLTDISNYSLKGHLALLQQLNTLYQYQKQFDKAALLYTKKTTEFLNTAPILALTCADFALRNYAYCPETQAQCAMLYTLKATIYYQRLPLKHLSQAINNLAKAQALEKTPERAALLAAWQNEFMVACEQFGAEIYSQFEYCVERYYFLQLQYDTMCLEQDRLNLLLYTYLSNPTVDLVIKLRALLDQAYNKLINTCIYEVNGHPAQKNYYPIADTEEELNHKFHMEDLLQPVSTVPNKIKNSLNTHLFASYEILKSEQPYFYFNPKNNSENTRFWQQSWLEEVNMISNDTKHIVLSIQAAKKEIVDLEKGTLLKSTFEHTLSYVKTGLSAQRFFENFDFKLLPPEFSIDMALHLSQIIYIVLENNEFIKNKKSIHPLALRFADIEYDRRFSPQKFLVPGIETQLSEEKNALIKQLTKLVLSVFEQHVFTHTVISFNDSQRAQIAMCSALVLLDFAVIRLVSAFMPPDAIFAVLPFLNNAITGTQRILAQFGKDYHAAIKSFNKTEKPIEKLSEDDNKPSPLMNREQLIDQFNAFNAITVAAMSFADLKSQDLYLQQLTASYRQSQDPKAAGICYKQVAEKMALLFPWLALSYYKKAITEFKCLNSSIDYITTQLAYISLLEKCGHLLQAKICFEEIQNFQGKLSDEQRTHYKTIILSLSENVINVDCYIYAQLQYIKEQYAALMASWFHYFIDPAELFLKENIENNVMEVLIKLRCLLDQTYKRFILTNLLLPNYGLISESADFNKKLMDFEKTERGIQYPNANSLKTFQKRLVADGLLSFDSSADAIVKKTFIDFPECYQAILASQSFSKKSTQSFTWIEPLFLLSNFAKHEGMLLLTTPKKTQEKMIGDTIENLFQIRLSTLDAVDIFSFPTLYKASVVGIEEIISLLFKAIKADEKSSNELATSGVVTNTSTFFKSLKEEGDGKLPEFLNDTESVQFVPRYPLC